MFLVLLILERPVTIPAMLKANNCNLYGIASRNLDKAKEFQDLFGFDNVYGSYEDLLDDENIDVVCSSPKSYTW